MHKNAGKSLAQCLHDRTDYAKNPAKTENGELISSYECAPESIDAEFLYSKRQYSVITGREYKNDVIAYQIRQSFKPGEVTPDEANKIGYELAMRFLKGKHAFIVCTHVDKRHIHNHIIFNSTTLDCTGKFKDFLGSGRAVARLSDLICIEHNLSVIQNPKRYTHSTYDKWLGENVKPSHREILRGVIDEVMSKNPPDMEAFIRMMEEAGYSVKRGKHLTFRNADMKQSIRLRSLGEGYTEDDIRDAILGKRKHEPKKRIAPKKNSLLIDIEAKLESGKGRGYEIWAKKYNLKQMAQTLSYLREHDLLDYEDLKQKTASASARYSELSEKIKSAEKRMAEIAVLKTHIINYARTREVYQEYKKSGYSKKYLAAHEGDIILHQAAKKAFNEMGVKKLPSVKALNDEYAALLREKKADFAEYKAAREEMRELIVHKSNIEKILEIDEKQTEKKLEKGKVK